MNKKLDEVFDADNEEVTNLVVMDNSKSQEKTQEQIVDSILEADLLDDYQASRSDFEHLMGKGKEFLEELMFMAKETQNPRFFEAANQLLKNLAETNAGRMDVHQKLVNTMKIKSDIGLKTPAKVTVEKAIIFSGTTADLLKQVKPRQILDLTKDKEE